MRSRRSTRCSSRDAPFHIHFSDIAYANRNEKHHLPYGEGTLRADPLREALERFDRPATVISESPDEASSQAIKAVLTGCVPWPRSSVRGHVERPRSPRARRRARTNVSSTIARFVVAVADAQECRERFERFDPVPPEAGGSQDIVGLAQEALRLVVSSLSSPHEAERQSRRRARRDIRGTDGLPRLESEPLRFVEPSLFEQRLGEQALALDECSPVLERLQDPDRLAQDHLCACGIVPLQRHDAEPVQRPAERHGGTALGEEGARFLERGLGVGESPLERRLPRPMHEGSSRASSGSPLSPASSIARANGSQARSVSRRAL